jgi:hypothetical protein
MSGYIDKQTPVLDAQSFYYTLKHAFKHIWKHAEADNPDHFFNRISQTLLLS